MELCHSGLSPHPYELIVLPNNVRVCFGCGSPFKMENRRSPNSVMIRHSILIADSSGLRRQQDSLFSL